MPVAHGERLSLGLLAPLVPPRKGVRLLGISLSSLTQAQATGRQLSLVLRLRQPSYRRLRHHAQVALRERAVNLVLHEGKTQAEAA